MEIENLIHLEDHQTIFIGRHGNCLKAENDVDRMLSPTGTKDSRKLLFQLPGQFSPSIIVSSPAQRVLDTSKIVFGDMPKVSMIIHDDLYNFGQFPNADNLYSKGVKDPREYVRTDSKEITIFQKNLLEFLRKEKVLEQQEFAIMSHAIISNFIAMMFTQHDTVKSIMLPESSGFLITNKKCQLIIP